MSFESALKDFCEILTDSKLMSSFSNLETATIYFILRADACISETPAIRNMRESNLVSSDFVAKTLAAHINKPEPTVYRCLEELSRKGWIKFNDKNKSYVLGEVDPETKKIIWYVDKKRERMRKAIVNTVETNKEKILAIIESYKKRQNAHAETQLKIKLSKKIPQEVKNAIIQENVKKQEHKRKVSSKSLWGFYNLEYKKRFNHFPPLASRLPSRGATPEMRAKAMAKTTGLLKRYIQACFEDQRTCEEMFIWVMDNWQPLSFALGMSGYPTINVFATKNILERFFIWREHGIPTKRATSPHQLGRRGDEERHASSDNFGSLG